LIFLTEDKMKKIFLKTVVIIFISSTVFAQDGVHKHDGFFLRMLYGFGYAELVEKDVLGSDLKFSGAAAAGRFQIGGTVSENLILYGEVGYILHIDPELEWAGYSASNSDATIFAGDFGGGITYYMPSNFYFSLSLLLSQASSGYDEVAGEESWFGWGTHSSEYGFGINAMVGKEWWVGDDWALGAAIYGYYSTMKDKGTIAGTNYEYDINNFSVGVMFSATYN